MRNEWELDLSRYGIGMNESLWILAGVLLICGILWIWESKNKKKKMKLRMKK